jgi:hypothetical protein
MLKYILFQEDEAVDRIRDRFYISAVSGLAMLAAFIHGLSLFVPMQMRQAWLDYKKLDSRFFFLENFKNLVVEDFVHGILQPYPSKNDSIHTYYQTLSQTTFRALVL